MEDEDLAQIQKGSLTWLGSKIENGCGQTKEKSLAEFGRKMEAEYIAQTRDKSLIWFGRKMKTDFAQTGEKSSSKCELKTEAEFARAKENSLTGLERKMETENFTQTREESFARLRRRIEKEDFDETQDDYFANKGRKMKAEDFTQTLMESLKMLERNMKEEYFNKPQEESDLLNILFILQSSFLRCVEVYKPVAEKNEKFYGYYRLLYDQTPRCNKRFLHILSKVLIKNTECMISIQKHFGKISQELQYIQIIIDLCLTSAIEFFFVSSNRILSTMLTVNSLISECVKNMDKIHDIAESKVNSMRT